MIIPIRSERSKPQQWALIELNGEIMPPLKMPSATNSKGPIDIELGSLRYTNEGTPMMIIGSHELRGKIENLKQPYAIMRKKQGPCERRLEEEDVMNGPECENRVEYEVAGVITKRLLFDHYPKSIMRST
mmetsp:Transcript_37034/g.45277  ORF Transcript_37034/g.45277 Transcript_37034/m.45277 type:complete len:130 (-) Transcript_37034:267-656(-)|eukprot:CAMPEP_0172497398 /NCGR_PEP_ID=MMETSP1066-20121228/99342_1 /TAXON_ID=671091 /ORGANISM="Coscinodiscus wailesii, Strain CCMP2513" /LENGTH=129 /DNA_ID=CAMNT_0013270147 /DNA_START=74 /DNA_END=463 /DNA_ORIENTATION=+